MENNNKNNNEVFEDLFNQDIFEGRDTEVVIEENKIVAAAKDFFKSPINRTAAIAAGALCLASFFYKAGKKSAQVGAQDDAYQEGYDAGFGEGYEEADFSAKENNADTERISFERGVRLGLSIFKDTMDPKDGE